MNLIDDKYEVLRQIKEGGMGAIYKVRHRLLDEIRVVKVMRPQTSTNEDLQRRFLREARLAIRVRHTNIGQLYDFSIDPEGTAFIVMEFIDGVTVQEILASGPPPSLAFTVDIALQVLDALSCLHSNGIVHRDIASDNVMITRSFDGRALAKVIDLGIAKDPGGQTATATVTGMFIGKVRYAAPEQFNEGSAGPSPATDLYSFGVFLYEMLTGRLPVKGASFAQLAVGHLFEAPLPFSETDPEGRVPEGLRELVLQALRKNPEDRIASAEEFARRLRAFALEPGRDGGELDALLRRAKSDPGDDSEAGQPSGPGASQGAVSPDGTAWSPAAEVSVDMLVAPGLTPAGMEILEAVHEYGGTPDESLPTTSREAASAAARLPEPVPEAEPSPTAPRRDAPGGGRPRRDPVSDTSWEPPFEPRPRPRRGSRAPSRREVRQTPGPRSILPWLLTGLAVLIAATGAAWLVVGRLSPAPALYAEQIEEALALPVDSTVAIERKLKRVSSLIDLLPEDDPRVADMNHEKGRLANLHELHRLLDRLVKIEETAAASGGLRAGEADGVSQVWRYMRRTREEFARDDPDALRIEERARESLRRISETPGAEPLRDLAQEP